MNKKLNKQTENRNSTKILLTVLSGVLVIFIGAAAFLIVSSKMKEKSYSEAIVSAEKYLAGNNYQDAIIEYKKAISASPEDDEAYLALADIYVEQEEGSKAKAILKKGMEETSSFKIRRMLSSLNAQNLVAVMNDGKRGQSQYLDLSTASADIAWNTSFMQKISGFKFSDYQDKFGRVESSQMDEEGYLEVVHSGFDGTCYYRNTDENKDIVAASRKTPTSNGMPERITLNSLGTLFRNFEGGISLSRLQMLFGEKVTPVNKEDMYYIQTQAEDCIIRIETDSEGNIVSPEAWNEIILLNANLKEDTTGRLSGVVLDAVTGKGVKQATLTFQPTKKANKKETVKTDASGIFTVDLKPDHYTVKISAADFIEEEFLFVMEKDKNYSGEQFTISPELTKGTARIVLEWNSEPQDLDSYLMGESDKSGDVSVNFRNKQAKSGADLVAELDLDETDGYGPETTTIYDLNGVYEFQVADFRCTGTMKQYGATVKVYLPGKDPVTITIDPGADVKDIWVVCEIDHGELNIMNEAPESDEFTSTYK